MKEKNLHSNWDRNLKMMTGRPLSLCEEEDLKQDDRALESDKLVHDELKVSSEQNMEPMPTFDLPVHPLVRLQNDHQFPSSKDIYSQAQSGGFNYNSNSVSTSIAGFSTKKKKLDEAYQKQKSMEKRASDSNEVRCCCCSVNGTCVGIIGVFLLIAMAVALLSVPGAGKMPDTVPIFISNRTAFMDHYNDSYNYSFLVLKHIRSYTRYTFIRKPDIPRTFVSISFNLGWFDDHLSREPGITKLLFDRLPYESYFKRNPINSEFFKLIHRTGATFTNNVGPVVSQIDISIPNDHLKALFILFNKNYGFGEVSVPLDMKSYLTERLQTGGAFDAMITLLPAPEIFLPKFSTGSISTLNRTDIQERLWEFYDRYYSANLITVAIIGNETLDTLQSWAEEIFTAIPNKDKTKPVFNMLPFPPGNKDYISRAVYFQPKSDKDGIKFIFPVNIRDYPNLSYLANLLGYEGTGSLYQYLSTRGYVTSLSASISVEAQNFVLFSVYCDLTEKGLTDPKFIVEALFQFIKRVRDEGVNEPLWQENKLIDELRFKFKEKEDPATYASTISAHMARVTDPRDYLDPPSRMVFNESLEEDIMSYISPDNFNMYISSLQLSNKSETVYGPELTKVEKWYNTPYENVQIKQADIDNWKGVALEENLHLPDTNPFIPVDFTMRDYVGTVLPVTVDATEVSDMTVWWYQDNEFNQPKLHLGCRIQPKPKIPTIRHTLLSKMLSGVFLRQTSESLYPAVIVDYHLTFVFDDFWVLFVSGFSDESKVKKVIEKGLDALFELDFAQDIGHFNATVREPIRKTYLNIKNWMPATLTRRYAKMLQDEYLFDYPDALAIIDSLTQNDVRDMRDDFLSNIAIDCSIIGNLDRDQAADYANILKTKLVDGGSATIVKEDRLGEYTYPLYKLPKNQTLVLRRKVENPDEPNSGVVTQFQIGPSGSNGPYKDKAKYHRYILVTLLALMMREPCFNYLRTQQQLGYVASCYKETYKDILLFNILVQGSREDAGAYVIAQEHDKFINLQYDIFVEQGKTDDGQKLWQDIKIALRKQIEERPISISEKTSQFNTEIFSTTRDFGRKAKKVAALENITLEDFLEFYKRYLMGENRRKISSQVYGKYHKVRDTVDESKGEVLITDIEKYRRENLTERFGADE